MMHQAFKRQFVAYPALLAEIQPDTQDAAGGGGERATAGGGGGGRGAALTCLFSVSATPARCR